MPELTMFAVRTWIKTVATGDFHYKQVLEGTIDPKAYAKLREYIGRCCEESICEPLGRKDGWYRPLPDLVQPVNWQGVEPRIDFPVVLPFDLRRYVFIYPNTVIIVAGAKDAGKTGFLMRTVVMNMGVMPIKLLTNMEGGKEQLKDRFDAMDVEIPIPAPFQVIPVFDNFHDYIKEPDTLYVIDYIDAPDGTEFYMIGAQISKIRKRLVDSVAIIGLQKPGHRDTAFGGELTLKEATLYLAMNTNKIKIVNAKVPADPMIIPRGMEWTFQYDQAGTNFLNIIPTEEV